MPNSSDTVAVGQAVSMLHDDTLRYSNAVHMHLCAYHALARVLSDGRNGEGGYEGSHAGRYLCRESAIHA